MFNFNINWLKIIKETTPSDNHSVWLFDWLKVLVSPFVKIYQEFLIAYDAYVLKIRYNGQVNYLEKRLNDRFSPTIGGIYIVDCIVNSPIYLYRKIEVQPPLYLYRKWKGSITYPVDDYAVMDNKVFKCLISNISHNPSLHPTYWQYVKEVTYLNRNNEFNIQYNFIVRIPSLVTFNVIELRAIVDFYRLAGKRYKIEIY